jgi:hypothetical protein
MIDSRIYMVTCRDWQNTRARRLSLGGAVFSAEMVLTILWFFSAPQAHALIERSATVSRAEVVVRVGAFYLTVLQPQAHQCPRILYVDATR